MPEPTPEHRLAHAFLALSDEPGPPRRPSFAAMICAVAAAVVLAFAAPLAWASGGQVDQPAATKQDATPALEQEDGDDPAAPPDDDGTDGATAGDTWAATEA